MKHGGGKLYIKNKNMLWIHIILIFQKGTNDNKYITYEGSKYNGASRAIARVTQLVLLMI
jgi:hypothetical protein